MPQARKNQVSLDVTPYYHCISRCVRRAYLCGVDQYTGRNFEHRRQWVVDRINVLSQIFSIDVCAYAIMNNHFHLVVKIQQDRVRKWSVDEVISRWTQIFSAPALVCRYQNNEYLDENDKNDLFSLVETWRSRLYSLSWFMRTLNEWIARQANREDECTGRFWEGRFYCQALLDEVALLTAMAYVDLNPIRAKQTKLPEKSEFTSIQARIIHASNCKTKHPKTINNELSPQNLMPFNEKESGLPFKLEDYLDLVDWCGRLSVLGKSGKILDSAPPILNRLKVNQSGFVKHVLRKNSGFHYMIGRLENIRAAAKSFGNKFFKGQQYASTIFA